MHEIAGNDPWAPAAERRDCAPARREGTRAMPPSTSEQCLERADACERRAAIATNEDTRETMLYLANRWRAMAAEGPVPVPS